MRDTTRCTEQGHESSGCRIPVTDKDNIKQYMHNTTNEIGSDSLGIGAAAQTSHAGVNHADAHLQRSQDVGQRLAIAAAATTKAAKEQQQHSKGSITARRGRAGVRTPQREAV